MLSDLYVHAEAVSSYTKRNLIGIVVLCIFMCQSAQAVTHDAYVGLDAVYNYTNLQTDYGKDFFKHTTWQYNIFLGHYVTALLGVECGYIPTKSVHSNVFVPAGTNQFGQTNFTGIASNYFASKKSLAEVNISLVPQIRLYKSLSLLPVIGLSVIKSTETLHLLAFDGAPATIQDQDDYNVYFSTTKVVPRLGVRLQYWIFAQVGVRVSCTWEQTSRLQPVAYRNVDPTQQLVAKLGNSVTVGIGAIVKC